MQQRGYCNDRDKMKREIQSQIADALSSSDLIGNCSSAGEKERENSKFNQVIEKLEDISTNLAASYFKEGLINLHQPGVTASHPALSCQEVLQYDMTSIPILVYIWLLLA